MRLLNNPELKKEIIASLAATALFFAAALLTGEGMAGFFVLALGLVLISIIIVSSFFRYKKIKDLSECLDRILHGQEKLLKDNTEGELSILGSEIRKMTVMLCEQSDNLLAEKVKLTDAIADIFHQMRTPLTSMNLVVSLLSDENLDYEKRIELTRQLKKQLERMQWLVESLLKISKIDAGTAVFMPTDISACSIIKKAAEPFLVSMELKGVAFNVSCSDERLYVDPLWTTEALSNLVKNCLEHTPQGGSIGISAQETALYTEIVVKDSGEGFVPEDIPYIFDRFYKGKNATPESIGIGLALSRAIITNQNGTVKAENSPEGGARFSVRFYKNIV